MRTARLRLTAAATLALSAFAGVGLSAAADSTWNVTFVTADLPAGGRTIAATTDFVANVGTVVVQDSLTPTPAGWALHVKLQDGVFTEVCVPNADPLVSTCVNGAAAAATFTASTATVQTVGAVTAVLTSGTLDLTSVSSTLINPAAVVPITSPVALTTTSTPIATATYANATTAAVALYPATVTLGLNQATELASSGLASLDYVGAVFVETVVYTLVP